MNKTCPYCGEELEKGEARIRSTFRSFFLLGFSIQHLFFKTSSGKQFKVLNSGSPAESWNCSSCELLLLKKPKSD